MVVPAGIAPEMKVGDETVRIEVKVNLAITEHMICWARM
jgi:hypothetical protein